MKDGLIPSQKEKNLFFANVNVNLVGGLLAGLVGASFYDLVNLFGISKGFRIIYSFIFVIVFLLIMIYFNSKIIKYNQ